MTRYVLEVKIQAKSGDDSVLRKEIKDEQSAIDLFEKAKTFFTVGSADKLKEVFEVENKDFFFRGIPKLYKENIIREEYKP